MNQVHVNLKGMVLSYSFSFLSLRSLRSGIAFKAGVSLWTYSIQHSVEETLAHERETHSAICKHTELRTGLGPFHPSGPELQASLSHPVESGKRETEVKCRKQQEVRRGTVQAKRRRTWMEISAIRLRYVLIRM